MPEQKEIMLLAEHVICAEAGSILPFNGTMLENNLHLLYAILKKDTMIIPLFLYLNP